MSWTNKITNTEGKFAAIFILLSLVATMFSIFYPITSDLVKNILGEATLIIHNPKVINAPAWSKESELRFEMSNIGSSTAVLTSLKLKVIKCSKSKTLKMIIPGAPMNIHTHSIYLNDKEKEYNIRSHIYSEEKPPLFFSKGDVDAFIIKLSSKKALKYKFKIIYQWYDTQMSTKSITTSSIELFVDFPPDIRKLL